jgi:hypothetical protein
MTAAPPAVLLDDLTDPYVALTPRSVLPARPLGPASRQFLNHNEPGGPGTCLGDMLVDVRRAKTLAEEAYEEVFKWAVQTFEIGATTKYTLTVPPDVNEEDTERLASQWAAGVQGCLGRIPIAIAHERHLDDRLHLECLVGSAAFATSFRDAWVSLLRAHDQDRRRAPRSFQHAAYSVLVSDPGGLRYALKGVQCDDSIEQINWPAYDSSRALPYIVSFDRRSARRFRSKLRRRRLSTRPVGRPDDALRLARFVIRWIQTHQDRDADALAQLPSACIKRGLFTRPVWCKAEKLERVHLCRPSKRGRWSLVAADMRADQRFTDQPGRAAA